MCISRWERFLKRLEFRWNGGYYGGFNEVWQNCLKNVKFFDNLTEIAYQIVGFRQIIETGRVFDWVFVKFMPSYQSGVRFLVVCLLPHAEF